MNENLDALRNYDSSNYKLSRLLKGHRGCVNTLSWSQHGDLLLSGSDDTDVIVWDTKPGTQVKLCARLCSSHVDNIFDAKFAPSKNEERIISVARDGKACVFDGWARFKEPRIIEDESVNDCLTTLNVSHDTLKRIEFLDNSPDVFAVCSEDGRIYQYDLRSLPRRHVLLDFSDEQISLYSMSACPSKPDLLAVCGTDPFIRFYDRRKISNIQDTIYCWTAPAEGQSGSSFFTGVQFSRFSYDLAAYGINQKPCVINPVFQTDKSINVPQQQSGHDDFQRMEDADKAVQEGKLELADELLTELINRHALLRVHSLWREVFAAEMFNRALLHGLLRRQSSMNLRSMRKDLEFCLDFVEPSFQLKYLLLMVVLMQGDYEEFEMLCDLFFDLESGDGLDFKVFKTILALCEIDPAQIPNLIPKDIREVCQRLSYVELTSLGAVHKLKTGTVGDFSGCLGSYHGSLSKRTVKGVSFVGDRDQYVGVGCDGGYAFLYENPSEFGEEYSKDPVWAAKGDSHITNVVKGHPSRPIIATSGLDHTIKLFEPSGFAFDDSEIEDNEKTMYKTAPRNEIQSVVQELQSNPSEREDRFSGVFGGAYIILRI